MSASKISSSGRLPVPPPFVDKKPDDQIVAIDESKLSPAEEIRELALTLLPAVELRSLEYGDYDFQPDSLLAMIGRGVDSAYQGQELEKLCDWVAKDLPKSENTPKFRDALKFVFHRSLEEFVMNGSTPLDKVMFAELDKQMEQAVKNSPVTSTWWQQAKRNGVASLVVGTLGFGLVALVMKSVGNFSTVGPAGAFFANFAGPWIAFVVEATIGAIKAGGAGYVALDSAAYQGYDTLVSKIARKKKHLEGLKKNERPRQDAIKKAEKELATLRTKIQPIVVDLLRREFGHSIGLKKGDEQPDVPVSCICQCINSKLTVTDDGGVGTGEAEALFRVVRSSDTEVIVAWRDGTESNLLKDPIPADCQAEFEAITDALIDAARGRSRITDDVTFLIFGLPFLWNMAGPYMIAAGMDYARVGDVMLMFSSSFFGSFFLVFLQNAVRSYLMGAPTGWGSHTPVIEAKHNRSKMQVQVARARLEAFRQVRSELTRRIDTARERLRKPGSEQDQVAAQARLDEMVRFQAELKRANKALVKAKKAGKTEVRRTAGLMPMSGEGLWASWVALKDNPPRALGKVLGYTLTYAIYSGLWTYWGQGQVRPHVPPPPGNGTESLFANVTEGIAANATTVASTAENLSSWMPFMVMNGLGGWVMSTVFIARNNPITRGVEYGLDQMLGRGERDRAAKADNSLIEDSVTTLPAVPEDPSSRLVAAWSNYGSLRSDVSDRIWTVLAAIDVEALTSGDRLTRQLEDLFHVYDWGVAEALELAGAIDSIRDNWEDPWKTGFAGAAVDMRSALANIGQWCEEQYGAGQLISDELTLSNSTRPTLAAVWSDAAKKMGLDLDNSRYIDRLLQDLPEGVLQNGSREQVFLASTRAFLDNRWRANELTRLAEVIDAILFNMEDWGAAFGEARTDMTRFLEHLRYAAAVELNVYSTE